MADRGTIKSFFKGSKAKRTIPFWQLWDEFGAMLQGKNISRLGTNKNYNFYADLVSMYSGTNNVLVVYTIDKLPDKLPIGYKAQIRAQVARSVRVSFADYIMPHDIEFGSDKMKVRARTMVQQKNELGGANEITDLVDSYNDSKRLSKFEQSYRYFFNATQNNHRVATLQTCIFVAGTRGTEFDESLLAIEKYCSNLGIIINRVTGNIEQVLKRFSPFSLEDIDNVTKKENVEAANVFELTDELLARTVSFTHGMASYGSMMFGTDLYSNKPVLKDPKRTDDSAENWLIAAETGGGKSFLVKFIILQLLANRNYIVTINDLEGGEYVPILYYVADTNPDDVALLNMGEGQGAYFDPVPVYLCGDPEQDADMLRLSQNFVISLFKTLAGRKLLDEYLWAEIILKQGIDNFYAKIGVNVEDKNTWTKTQQYSIFDVFHAIRDLVPENDEASEAKAILISRLSTYFATGKGQATIFKHKIEFDSIRSKKLLLCSFGMAGKAATAVDETAMQLMQLYTANITHLRTIFAKAQKKYSTIVWEELPRWGDFPDSEKTLKTALVGGRKLGQLNLILTNMPGELVTTDRFGIFEAITTFALGAIGNAETRARLCELLSIQSMLPELNNIAKHRTESQKQGRIESAYGDVMRSPYNKSFLIGIDRVDYYLSKVILPQDIAASQLFKTGVLPETSTNGLKES